MSYSSAVSLNYTPNDIDFQNVPIFPLLTNSSTSNFIASTEGTLTSGVVYTSGSILLTSGIYTLKFRGTLTASANTIVLTQAYASILPEGGGLTSAIQSIIQAPDGGFTAAANTPYYFSVDECVNIISDTDTNFTTFTVNAEWAGAGTVSLGNVQIAYQKIT
jgi:hypothetical protein